MIDELPPLPAPALKIQRAYGEEEGFYSDVHMSHYALVVYHMRDAEVAELLDLLERYVESDANFDKNYKGDLQSSNLHRSAVAALAKHRRDEV